MGGYLLRLSQLTGEKSDNSELRMELVKNKSFLWPFLLCPWTNLNLPTNFQAGKDWVHLRLNHGRAQGEVMVGIKGR